MDMESVYKAYTPLLKNRAYQWARPGHIGLEYNDFISIGNEVFLYCWDKWEEKRATFGTYFKKCLNNAFQVECRLKTGKKYATPLNTIDDDELDAVVQNAHNPESSALFKIKLEQELSPMAQVIINTALNVPDEMLEHIKEETGLGVVNKRRITRYMTEVENWPIEYIQDGLKEIKECFARK
jgi:hypothetical protein